MAGEEETRGRPRGRIVDSGEIVEAALGLVRSDGVEALSMRKLAAELGVTVAATYYYFPDKDGVVDAVADTVVRGIFAVDDIALGWKDRLVRILVEQNKEFCRYPGVASFLVRNRVSAAALRWCNGFLSILFDSGMRDDDVAESFAAIAFYVDPVFLVENARGRSAGMFPTPSTLAQVPGRYPAIERMLPHLGAVTHADEYELGARRLADALDRRFLGG